MRTGLALLFVATVAGGAAYVAQRPTVADGKVLAADLLDAIRDQGITEVTCDDEAPVGWSGMEFRCHVAAKDGSTAVVRYTVDCAGSFKGKVEDGTRPTRPHPAGVDPWAE
jgi:hypothetical protein